MIDTVYLDVETTGLDPRVDEIVQIGLLDDTGEVLLDTMVMPQLLQSWPDAERIHGISPEIVRGAPHLFQLKGRLVNTIYDKEVVIYNADFDAGFLYDHIAEARSLKCCMLAFSEYIRVPRENTSARWNRSAYKWFKLTEAAEHVGFVWPGAAHRAIHDCKATRAVWHFLREKGAI